MPTVFLNGAIFDSADLAPMISALDAATQHGVGLFETLLGGSTGETADTGTPAWALGLDEHLHRLATSAADLGLSPDLRTGPLADAVLLTIARSGLPRARVRLTITGGEPPVFAPGAPPGSSPERRGDPSILIVAQPATVYPAAMYARGITVTLAATRPSPISRFEGHKTLNYWWRLSELRDAGAKGAAEALVFSVTNHLIGGCVSNALLVTAGELITPIARGEEGEVQREHERAAAPSAPPRGPMLPSPTLPGVTRLWAIRTAAAQGILTRRRMVSIDDVLSADELLVTNSSWGVLPVCKVEGHTVGGDQPGPIGRLLVERWHRALEERSL
jgi:branched-subunit amino acid aminotransferase/4-amino-4-deoxychorismate lyase